MKKLLFVASFALFSFNCAVAGTGATDMPSDSTRTKNGLKKVELKRNEAQPLVKGENKKTELKKVTSQQTTQTVESKAKESKGQTTLKDDAKASSPAKNTEKSVSIEELKESAKKNAKPKKIKKANETPPVSYPYYTGGNVAIREFIRKHQHYPEECKSERLTGRVEVTMTISCDGTPHNPRITKSSGNEYMDAEAMRIAEMMPRWNPAEESDSPQEIEYTIFVNFRPRR